VGARLKGIELFMPIRNPPRTWHGSLAQVEKADAMQYPSSLIIHIQMSSILTPVDIACLDRDEMDVSYTTSMPSCWQPFRKHQVNDRMIYGPLERAQVWATKRLGLFEIEYNCAKTWV
jgi:hypothetical protein